MTDAAVEMGVRAHLVTDTGHGFPVDLRLHYRRGAPYEVRAEVIRSGETYCRVIFARELLTYGISQNVGKSTVQVRPGPGANETCLRMAGGFALEKDTPLAPVIETHSLIRFLGHTYRLVPPGTEGMDFDAELADLLTGR
ncbi:SsgA family sporulation/cell division regulator [Streptomyces sp. NPDC002537]